MQPIKHNVYTFLEVLKELKLPDSPFFNFRHDGMQGTIQTSHLTDDELLTVPGIADTRWEYLYTTSEWCPIFRYVEDEPITKFIDIEPSLSITGKPEDAWWATPLGFPREQYVISSLGRLA